MTTLYDTEITCYINGKEKKIVLSEISEEDLGAFVLMYMFQLQGRSNT